MPLKEKLIIGTIILIIAGLIAFLTWIGWLEEPRPTFPQTALPGEITEPDSGLGYSQETTEDKLSRIQARDLANRTKS